MPNTESAISQKKQSDAASHRFHSTANTFEKDKPDTIDFRLGSPVSPLTTNTSSSSSSSGSITRRTKIISGGVLRNSGHSGELSGTAESSPKAVQDSAGSRDLRRSKSGSSRHWPGPLIYSGGIPGSSSNSGSGNSGSGSGGSGSSGGGSRSSVSSLPTNVLPVGNICPSGKIGMMSRSTARADVLGRGCNYGHGSIIRGSPVRSLSDPMPPITGKSDYSMHPPISKGTVMTSMNLEEVKRVGNEHYKKGQFSEALNLYDQAIAICPENAACRSNRAATLMAMGRLGEAVKECEHAVRLDPMYGRAHQRLASLYLRLGHVEDARKHHNFTGELPDPAELEKLQTVEKSLTLCANFWKMKDWKNVLRESNQAITSGADSSLLLIALKSEALLRLNRLDDADSHLSTMAKLEILVPCSSQNKFLGMISTSFVHGVRAQIDIALGRFENAELSAERSKTSDPQSQEAARVLAVVKSVSRARARGNQLFLSENYSDACLAYGTGLKSDPFNPVLYCNRAACYSKLGQWEKSIEDCNDALKIKPNYAKALHRRATSYAKVEMWKESVRDYEVLRKQVPNDTAIAEALFHAQVALKASQGEEVSNLKFGGEVEKVVKVELFEAAISLPGVTIVQFTSESNQQCVKIAPFVDALCTRNPSLNFLKVDVNESSAIAKSENVRIVPTFKIYKNGSRVKEMICPSQQVLEFSVRHYAI